MYFSVTSLPYPNVSTSLMFSQVAAQCLGAQTLSTLSTSSTKECEDSCGKVAKCTAFVSSPSQSGDVFCDMKTGKCDISSPSSKYSTYLKGVDLQCKYIMMLSFENHGSKLCRKLTVLRNMKIT